MKGNEPYLIALLFVAAWIGAGLMVSHMSGWSTLAQRFRFEGTFTGQRWTFRCAQMRWLSNYNNCLTVGASPEGLYISMLFLFRIGHPALLIPWHEISVSTKQWSLRWFGSYVEMTLGGPAGLPFRIRPKLAARLQEAAGGAWPAESVG